MFPVAQCQFDFEAVFSGDLATPGLAVSFAGIAALIRRREDQAFRLTNGFSKKVENHAHSVALFAMYYNFVRVHKTLRVTAAVERNTQAMERIAAAIEARNQNGPLPKSN